jgi:Zn-dependent peptidase ImmA (M78 family)/DNA-binding XRE family transcriptional regulator
MTIGVKKFIGERLTEAREARGILTMSSLAELLEVSRNAISLYESNKSDPRPQIVTDIAQQLKVKESFFFMPLPNKPENPIFWRSRHTSTKHSRIIVERKFGWSKWLIDEYLKSFMDMPKLNIPNRKDLGVPDNPKDLTNEKIEEIALRCREFWGLGIFPIENVTALLENNGFLVTCGYVNSDKLDAFSNISEYDHSRHIFLSLDKQSALRTRFDACHEVAHLILHSHLSKQDISERMHKLTEDQAYRFASAFLMPSASFKKDVWMTSIEAFKVLKKDWKVSVAAIIKRCDDLGLLGDDEEKTRRLWIKYRREWQNIEEDTLEFETPQLMKRCVDALLESGLKTKSQILYEIPFTQTDIESLLNLPSGYLDEDFGELKNFPTIKPNQPNSSFSSGQVIPFTQRNRA